MLTFLYFSHSKRHSSSIQIPLENSSFPVILNFPSQLVTTSAKDVWTSDSSREVAEIIGVTESSIWNREHCTEPELQYNPSIIKFLGYIPFDCPDGTVGHLAWYKRARGMNFDDLGEIMGRDPEQLSDWLSGRHNPFSRNREKIELFLEQQGFMKHGLIPIPSFTSGRRPSPFFNYRFMHLVKIFPVR